MGTMPREAGKFMVNVDPPTFRTEQRREEKDAFDAWKWLLTFEPCQFQMFLPGHLTEIENEQKNPHQPEKNALQNVAHWRRNPPSQAEYSGVKLDTRVPFFCHLLSTSLRPAFLILPSEDGKFGEGGVGVRAPIKVTNSWPCHKRGNSPKCNLVFGWVWMDEASRMDVNMLTASRTNQASQ